MGPPPTAHKPWLFGYAKLYNCLTPELRAPFDQETFENFLSGLKLPKLTKPDLHILNAPITGEELANTINHLPLHKLPGPDGLPYFYYRTFSPILSPQLLSL